LKPVRKRKLVDEMRGDWDVSIRRACRVFLVDTSTYHYKSRRPGQAPCPSSDNLRQMAA
jgi:putative transposase